MSSLEFFSFTSLLKEEILITYMTFVFSLMEFYICKGLKVNETKKTIKFPPEAQSSTSMNQNIKRICVQLKKEISF